MRRLGLVLTLLLLAPALAGCIGNEGEDVDPNANVDDVPLRVDKLPPGASLEPIENGLQLVWENLSLPFDQEIEIPRGATMVRVTGHVASAQGLFVHLAHAETGRRRCNVPYFQAWEQPTTGTMSCAGLTAVDPLPTSWTVTVSGPAQADLVTVELLDVRLDGIAGQVNTDALSMPVHELDKTTSHYIDSHDGAQLYLEVTKPKGDGPWPVILASSPYNGPYHEVGQPAMWSYFVKDWAMRGYAVIVADVRGFGNSGGCVEVWGENEQKDQVVLVEWAAEQDWSDGNVGFYGQSYVGTTPVEAAVRAPEALKAIIAVAPVNNAYDDWHFGGVPNGENALSPVAYQALTGTQPYVEESDPSSVLTNNAAALCDPTLTARANDPRAVYDAFYEARNFSAQAGAIQAATLYTHGFEDTNVKSQMAIPFFNAIDAPKLGLFGHWVHQHPVRADSELLFLAWMDQHVKGKDMGLEGLPATDVVTADGLHRTGESWPPVETARRTLYPDLGGDELGPEPSDTSASFLLDPAGAMATAGAGPAPQLPAGVTVEGPVSEDLLLSGQAKLRLEASLQGTDNGHVAAFLYDEGPNGTRLVTWGMANLAHRNGHDTYTPAAPMETLRMSLPFLPTEHLFEEGHTMRLEIRGAQVTDWSAVGADRTGVISLHGGAEGTALLLPTLPVGQLEDRPFTART